MTPQTALKVGWAVGKALAGDGSRVLIGKDTRISGYMFESALEAGLSAAGMDVFLLGPLPTPGVAYLTKTFRAAAGIVISASHNPYGDNGIKLFSNLGIKLADKQEAAIESWMDKELKIVKESHKLGKAHRIDDATGRYIEFCKSTVSADLDISGMNIVVDCAHGACYSFAKYAYKELGVSSVHLIGVEPDGTNINENCGATAPAMLQREVLERRADLGIGFDGDGDRLIMVDEKGEVVSGDELLAIIAVDRHEKGVLCGGVVGTQMSNAGLEKAMDRYKIPFATVAVGDRHIVQLLMQKQWALGGEPSGHIICFDKSSTGDAIVASLQVLTALAGRSLSEARKVMTVYPQKQFNVERNGKFDENDRRLAEVIAAAADALGKGGRVLVRTSGTEQLIRVLVEAESDDLCETWGRRVCEVVREINGA
jgi:phosphoglucosamine mutase